MDNLLFSSGDLRASLEIQAGKMREAVEAEPEESLKQAEADEWAEALAHHFAVACPELKTGDMWREPIKDVKVDISWDQSRDFGDSYSDLAHNFPGYRVVVHIPFEGDAAVFQLKTNPFNFNPPRGRVNNDNLILTIQYARDQQPNIDGQVQTFIDSVSTWLGWARSQIESFNSSLHQEATRAIEGRRQRIEQRDAHLAQSKIPVRQSGEKGKTYIPDVLVRRPAPSLPETRADDQVPKLEPALEERIFEHILSVIRQQGRQMEQNPNAYKQMGEEDRRQMILGTLNTHYEGFATAETHNYQGKTDILVRYEGKNLLVCECKFWTGPEGFGDTIDQLFRYVAWRDTKLAIVMFVREKGLKGILAKARATLGQHAQFVAWKEGAEETELRGTMHWPADEERLADLNVFFVHTPQARN